MARRRGERRRWNPYRQAYRPRIWPWAIAAAIPPILLATGMMSLSIGLAWTALIVLLADVRHSGWRRRHPPLTLHEYLETPRRWSRFN